MDKPVPRRRYPQLFERPTQAVFCRNNTTTNYPELDELMRSTQTPENIRTSYRDGLTIHGLTKLLTGVWWERIIWFVALFICIGVVAHFTKGFYVDFRKHDVRTEIRMHAAKNVSYPAVTVCQYNQLALLMELCYKNSTVFGYPCRTDTNNTLIDQLYYPSNRKYFTPHPIFSYCLIFNRYKNVTSNRKFYSIDFKGSVKSLYLYFHDQNDLFDIVDLTLNMERRNEKAIIFFSNIQHFTRLPYPHPSNCSSGKHGDNILPGPYTDKKCQQTCRIKQLVAKCGAIPEQYLNYAPHLRTLLPRYNNLTDAAVRSCIIKAFGSFAVCECRVSCTETLFKTRYTVSKHTIPAFGPMLEFNFDSKIITNITEIPTYPPEKFITDIGGWLGLFSGTSILSVLEIFLFLPLSVSAACQKLKRYLTERRS